MRAERVIFPLSIVANELNLLEYEVGGSLNLHRHGVN